VERAVILSHDPVLPAHLFEHQRMATGGVHPLVQQALQRSAQEAAPAPPPSVPANGIILNTLNVEEAERALIERALELTRGNRTKTADLLGISVRTLRNKLNGPQRAGVAGE
jgi:DNA-binding NtrC family response regulator